MTSPRAPVPGYSPILRTGILQADVPSLELLDGGEPIPFDDEAFRKHTLQSSASIKVASGWMFATEAEAEPWWQIDLGESMFIASMTVWIAPLPEGTSVSVTAHAFPTPRGDPAGPSFESHARAAELPVAVDGSAVIHAVLGAVARHVRVTLHGAPDVPVVLAVRGAEIVATPLFASTLFGSYARAFSLFADRPLFSARATPGEGPFVVTHTYREVWTQARRLAAALAKILETGPDDARVFLGLCVHNRAEWIVGEIAALMRGYVVVPLCPDDSDERLAAILARCPIDAALVEGDGDQRFARLATACPSLRMIIACDARSAPPRGDGGLALASFDAIVAFDDDTKLTPPARPRDPGDLFTVLFTSGSTGVPKGAMRSYATFLAMIRSYGIPQPSIHLSFQPLSHLSERMGLPTLLVHGSRVGFSGGGAHLLSDLRELEPTSVASVPRLFELVYASHQRRLAHARASDDGPLAGRDRRVWAESRAVFGSRIQSVSVGSAPCSPEVLEFLRRCFSDVWVAEGYGSTECGTITANDVVRADVDVKLVPVSALDESRVERGEIWVRTPHLIDGYFGDPEATAASRDAEGFFATGDLGERDADGRVRVVGRLKNVIKLSQGEFVAIDSIEAELAGCPLVDRIFVHPDATSSTLLGVVVPHFDALARALGVTDLLPIQLAAHPGAAATIVRALREHGRARGLASHEIPRTVLVETAPMTVESGLLTASGKLARPAAVARYAAQLAALGAAVEDIVDDGDSLLARLAGAVSRVVGRRVDPAESLHEGLGIDSLVAAEALGAAGDALGRELPLTLWFESRTLGDLARSLDRGALGRAVASADLPRQDLDLDLDLDFDLPAAPAAARTPPAIVLLTGATGLLGAHLLEALVARTAAQIVCLVRADSDEAAAERIRVTLARHEIPCPDVARWSALAGDLAASQLGLADAAWSHLAASVDAILHSGATVSWLQAYEPLRAPNVLGTRELLRLANTTIRKPFHFVSTISTVSADGAETTQLPFEQARAGGGYGLTKWVAEHLVRRAGEGGHPVAVYRPAMIAGHSLRGQGNPDDFVNRYLRACAGSGHFLDAPGERLDMTPVDYVAESIVALMAAQPEGGGTYHLTNVDQSMTYTALGESIARAGFPVVASDYAVFRAAAVRSPESPLRPLATYFPEQAFAMHMGPWPSGPTRRALAELGIVCPAVDDRLIAAYLGAMIRRGIL
ncbi:MAG: thioester reductase domain-containing protein, partial [Byssovorax sp.]